MNLHLLAHIVLIGTITVGTLWTIVTNVVTICSVLHGILPPWDFLKDYPRAQAAYKVFVYLVGYVAVNLRSTLYQSISTDNGTKLSDAAKTNGAGTAAPPPQQ